MKDSLGQIIDNLLLIKNIKADFSQIDKDILLQNIREAYLLVLQMPVNDGVQGIECQVETKKDTQEPSCDREMVEEDEEQIGEEKPSPENTLEETEINTEVHVPQEEEEEMDTDILEFIKNIPQETKEVKLINKELELFPETEVAHELEPEPMPTPETVIESEQNPEPTPELEPKLVSAPELVIAPEPISEQEVEIVPETQSVPESELEIVPEPEPILVTEPKVVPQAEPKPVSQTESDLIPEPETLSQTTKTLFADEPQPQVHAVKPQQRSLNDLFNEKKQDLGEKFQQSKIVDLTKAMSINDKFLFIRELFKNKSEEFSRAIQTLNKCENIEEAFDIMEGLKKQYFWDSTSSAYLALCDLVRRKF